MKLYTEHDIENAFNSGRGFGIPDDIKDLNSFIQSITPIELPSDENIEKENPFVWGSHVFGTRDLLIWEQGAKWMRDKIQGGNK